MAIPSRFYQENSFVGLDTFSSPYRLGAGYLTQADNLMADAGELVTRPGLSGQFSSKLSNAVYEPLPFLNADGSTTVLFTSGGSLYKVNKGANTPAALTLSGIGSLNSANTRLCRYGRFAYGVDGQNALFRTDLTTSQAVSGQLTPLSIPSAALTNTTLEAASDSTKWSGMNTPSTANLLTNAGFETGTTTTTNFIQPTGWTKFGADPDAGNAAGSGGAMTPRSGSYALLLDDNGEGISQTATCPSIPSAPVNTFAKARVYYFSIYINQKDPTGKAGVKVTLDALDSDGTTVLATVANVFTPPYSNVPGQWNLAELVGSFTSLGKDPTSIRVTLAAGPNNTKGTSSIYLDDANLQAADVTLNASQTAANSVSGTISETVTALTGFAVGGQYLKRTYAGTGGDPYADFSKYQVISCAVSFPGNITRPPLRFGFQQSGTTTVVWSPICSYSADGTYAFADISTVSAAVTSSLSAFYVQFVSDLAAVSGGGYSTVITLGPVSGAGNLTLNYNFGGRGADYTYLYEEWNEITSSDIIYSSGSPLSNAVQPTGQKAEVTLTLQPAGQPTLPTNASTTTHYAIYRFGGTFTDGYGRLVATVPIGSDVAYGADSVNPNYRWQHATKTFTDNTPDSALLSSASYYQTDRDPPPSGAQAICTWQDRLWLAQGNQLYCSWLLASGLESGLYFSLVNIQSDPNLPIKGATFQLGGGDNDPIVTMIPYGSVLIVLKQHSVWLVNGYDPTNFAVQSYLIGTGVGCVAKRAACLVENHVWFLGPNGIYEFDANVVDPKSVRIEKTLATSDINGNPLISPAAYGSCAMCYHNRRLFLFAPTAGDSANTAAYVWDSRTEGFTRFLQMTMTGGASLSSGTDSNDLFLAGLDGQIYQMKGSADLATPTASPSPISFALTSRAYGLQQEGMDYWRANKVNRLYALCRSGESMTLTLGLALPGRTWTQPGGYTVNGWTQARVKPPSDARGNSVQVTLSGTTSQPFRVASFGLEVSEGRLLG